MINQGNHGQPGNRGRLTTPRATRPSSHDGSLASQTYPSGRVVNFTYDGSGRPYSVQEPSSGPSYLNAVAYTAAGAIANLQLGNNLVEQTCYNDLLQPVARRLGDSTSTACAVQTSADLVHLGFGYGTASANNGNMMQQTIWAPDNGSGSPWSVTQDYTYDAVNRLATSAEKLGATPQWSRTYGYDHFGNRWISGATGHTLHMATPTSQSAIQATTNRLTGTGIAYDNAGNLTAHPYITTGSGAMAYDANNKMTAFTATGVSVATKYDTAGRRVRKIHNGKTTIWVYDAMGKLAAEYTTETQTDEATYFRTTDHLGSTRLTTDEVGDVVARRDYFPFGERIDSTLSGRGAVVDGTLVSFNSNPGMRQQFTGQQRDDETALDHFSARSYHANLGRFCSVDPNSAGATRADPQSWNAYSYVKNRSLFFVDPDGRTPVCAAIADEIRSQGPNNCDGYTNEEDHLYCEGDRQYFDDLAAEAFFACEATSTRVRPNEAPPTIPTDPVRFLWEQTRPYEYCGSYDFVSQGIGFGIANAAEVETGSQQTIYFATEGEFDTVAEVSTYVSTTLGVFGVETSGLVLSGPGGAPQQSTFTIYDPNTEVSIGPRTPIGSVSVSTGFSEGGLITFELSGSLNSVGLGTSASVGGGFGWLFAPQGTCPFAEGGGSQ